VVGLFTAREILRGGNAEVRVIETAVPGAGASGRSGALIRSTYETPEEMRLAEGSRLVYAAMAAAGVGGFEKVGLVTLFQPNLAGENRAGSILNLAKENDVEIRPISKEEAGDRIPRLSVSEVGAVLYQDNAGYCDPASVISFLYSEVRAQGGSIETGLTVAEIIRTNGHIVGVMTDRGIARADKVVIAAGAWSGRLLRGYRLPPMRTHLSRVALFRPFEFEPKPFPTIIDHTADAWFRPFPGGRILVGYEHGGAPDVDPDEIPLTAPEEIVRVYRELLARRFHVSRFSAPAGAWSGAFMVSADGRPIVGPVAEVEGLFVAVGDSGGAFKTAPAIAMALADEMTGRKGARFQTASLCPSRQVPEMVHQEGRTVSR
jgi:sarcosine oxidase subunit beta